MAFLHIFGLLCLLAATGLLIVVSVGAPVWDIIRFLDADVAGTYIRLGQWGTCVSGSCSKARLGYNLDFLDSNQTIGGDASRAVVHGLTYALILHPIAAGVSFIALLFAIGSNLVLGILGSLFAFFAFLVTLVAFAIDLGLFITARHRINDLGNGSHATLQVAIWLVLAALVLQLLASVTVCFTRSKRNRASRNADAYATEPVVNEKRAGGGRFWNRRNRNSNVNTVNEGYPTHTATGTLGGTGTTGTHHHHTGGLAANQTGAGYEQAPVGSTY